MEVYNGDDYPTPMTSHPRLWGTDYKSFLFPIFAVYFEKQKRFGLYKVKVAESYHILEPYKTERIEPCYLHTSGSPATHPLEVYAVKAQFPFCIWFQNAWLCRNDHGRMSAIFPVLRITNLGNNCKYTKYYSTAVYESSAASTWINQYSTIEKEMNRLAIQLAHPIPYEPVQPKAEPTPIPAFVATLIVEDAVSKKQDCSITMEPVTKESAVVTDCYHVFDKDAITRWLETNKTCPVCKQMCAV
jgi:hypothetical protein